MTDAINSINSENGHAIRIHIDQIEALAAEKNQGQGKQDDLVVEKINDQSDTVRITKDANLFVSAGLDRSQSVLQQSVDTLEFNLKFDTDKDTALTVKGTYSLDEERLKVSVNFNFVEPIKIDGKIENRTLNARVKLDLSNVRPDTFAKLERTGPGLQEIISTSLANLRDIANTRQYPPTSVVIHLESLGELYANPAQGGIFMHVSRGMMALNNSLARALGHEAPKVTDLPGNTQAPAQSLELSDFSYQLTDITHQAPKLSGQEIAPQSQFTTTNASAGPDPTGDTAHVTPVGSV